MLKSAWATLYHSIKNIINEAGFGTFFETLLNHENMSTKIFGYFLPWQSAFGKLPVPSIFQELGRYC